MVSDGHMAKLTSVYARDRKVFYCIAKEAMCGMCTTPTKHFSSTYCKRL